MKHVTCNIKNKKVIILILCITCYMLHVTLVSAGPQSTTYELKEFGFGSGGVASTSSTTYSMSGTAGEQDVATASSTSYVLGGGLNLTMHAAVPPAPSVTNPGTNYDRLLIVVQTGGNPTDTLFAISISDGVTTQYVQNDRTIAAALGSEDWLPYAGSITLGWGGASGFYVTGLKNNTLYTVRVKAKQGTFTESNWGPSASQSTADPTFTFGVDSSTITFSNLNASNSYSDSTKSTTITTSTNAYNGYLVYGYETQPLTHTTNGSLTIANYGSTNSSPTLWSGTGFGYATNDTILTGGTADRFTTGGPKYAGFVTTLPGDPVADHAGPLLSPVSNEQFIIAYRVTASATTTAGQYRTNVIYVATPTY